MIGSIIGLPKMKIAKPSSTNNRTQLFWRKSSTTHSIKPTELSVTFLTDSLLGKVTVVGTSHFQQQKVMPLPRGCLLLGARYPISSNHCG
jgi:hypothetical protein